MKRFVLKMGVCVIGLAFAVAGCGGGDGDDGGDESADLDTETEEILEVIQEITSNMGTFVSPTTMMAKQRVAAVSVHQSVPLDRTFFNESIPGFTSGSAVRNGNMHGTATISASETSGSVTISGNYLTMITFSAAKTQGGATLNGRLSDGGTMSGTVSVSTSNAGSGSFTFSDTIQSQPDFTVNGTSVSVLLTTELVISFANGNPTISGRQMGIINSRSVNRTF